MLGPRFLVLAVLLILCGIGCCDKSLYTVSSADLQADEYSLKWSGNQGPYGSDIASPKMKVSYIDSDIVRVRIVDSERPRWEVPDVVDIPSSSLSDSASSNLVVNVSAVGAPFGFTIQRKGSSDIIFNAMPSDEIEGMVYEDQYLQLSTALPSNPNIYGLGERLHAFRLDPTMTYTLYAADHGNNVDTNLYGSHPLYLEMRNGSAHGVFLLNSNAMDVQLENSPPNTASLTYKTIGGVFDLYFLAGPDPKSVMEQYTRLVGRPYLPPVWALGLHQCRWGYRTLDMTRAVWEKYGELSIPLDAIWNDIDYMQQYFDFTTSPTRFPLAEMTAFIEEVHARRQKYVSIIDCGIPFHNATYPTYAEGVKEHVFLTNASGDYSDGTCWPGHTYWPDFTKPATIDWWVDQYLTFASDGMPVDGTWVDMNEPTSFCNGSCDYAAPPHNKWDYPPYVPGERPLWERTLPMSGHSYLSRNYDTHNLYGSWESWASMAAMEAMHSQRAFVLSRSTFAGHGKYAFHWTGDNNSIWSDLYYSMTGIFSMGLFGIPMVGSDVCGFNGNTTAELCTRWYQLGSFYPFYRSHNAIEQRSQEPWAFQAEDSRVLPIVRRYVELRYSLLPYYYTLMANANTTGTPMFNPLLWEFPTDPQVLENDRQAMIGPALMLIPVLEKGASSVSGYLPPASWWYDFHRGMRVIAPADGKHWMEFPVSLEEIPLLLRGGQALVQSAAGHWISSADSFTGAMSILAGLNAEGTASGMLYLDDGVSLQTVHRQAFSQIVLDVSSHMLMAKPTLLNYRGDGTEHWSSISILGVPLNVSSLRVNGEPWQKWEMVSSPPLTQILTVFTESMHLSVFKQLIVEWE